MRARWRVYGRVQGVGFRWFIRQAARALHLRGYARNLPDGTVEVEADGADAAVTELYRTLTYGPPGARVDRVEPWPPGTDPLDSPFDVRSA
jgi:acylphosphatase